MRGVGLLVLELGKVCLQGLRWLEMAGRYNDTVSISLEKAAH